MLSAYQYAVEELVDKQAKHADDDIGDVQKEGDVHNDCLEASSERALVPHKTHQEDNLIQQLAEKRQSLTLSLQDTHLQLGQCKEHVIQFW